MNTGEVTSRDIQSALDSARRAHTLRVKTQQPVRVSRPTATEHFLEMFWFAIMCLIVIPFLAMAALWPIALTGLLLHVWITGSSTIPSGPWYYVLAAVCWIVPLVWFLRHRLRRWSHL